MFPGIMPQSVADVIILTINALGAGLLTFIAGVIQKIMNEMEAIEFMRFLNRLGLPAQR